jgi:hypothetical protein
LLVAAGQNTSRLRNERSFARLCGAAPRDASSGKQHRHRLSRAGDRQANSALWRIVISRLSHDPTTRRYLQRRLTRSQDQDRNHPLPQALRRPPALPPAPTTTTGLTPPRSINLCAVRNWASGLFACLLLAACGSNSGERTDGALDTTTSKAEQTEHAVIVHISNSTDPNIGLDMIEDPLIDAIEAAGVGEFDGNEIGPDEALLFMAAATPCRYMHPCVATLS